MPTITSAPKLLPTTVPKKTTDVEAYIEVQYIKKGEVIKQIIYILIAQTTACYKPGCRNILKRYIN